MTLFEMCHWNPCGQAFLRAELCEVRLRRIVLLPLYLRERAGGSVINS